MILILKLFLSQLCFVSLSTSLPQSFESAVKSQCRVKEVKSGQLRPCVFPFSYGNKIHTTCTDFKDPDRKFWCSTRVDSRGVHVGGIDAWGHCDMSNEACSGKTSGRTVIPPSFTKMNTNFKDDSKGTWKPSAEKGECGLGYPEGNVIGGIDARPGEFPYMALLGYKIEDNSIAFLCGGTLINRYYVLTAAHCQTGKYPIHNVIIGENIVGDNPDCTNNGCLPVVQDIKAADVTVHEGWNPEKIFAGSDIALVRLAEPAKFYFDEPPKEASASPICLPWSPSDPGFDLSEGASATVTGWGRITNNKQENNKNLRDFKVSTRMLQKASLPIANAAGCVAISKEFRSTNQICAGGVGGVDSCNGDSGGPLAYKRASLDDPWYLIGIVSYGTTPCAVGSPGVYTKVTSYLDWIERNMKP